MFCRAKQCTATVFPHHQFPARDCRGENITTIACNREMMAADSQQTRDSGLVVGRSVCKLKRIKNVLVACQGTDEDAALFERWYSGLRSYSDKPDLKENFAALVLSGGRIYMYYDKCVPVEVFEDYIALGSGDEVAMGAMAAGASPERAVEIACELNAYTGPPVVVERF